MIKYKMNGMPSFKHLLILMMLKMTNKKQMNCGQLFGRIYLQELEVAQISLYNNSLLKTVSMS